MHYQQSLGLKGRHSTGSSITELPTFILFLCLSWTIQATSTQSAGPVPTTTPLPSTFMTSTKRSTAPVPQSPSASAGGALAPLYQKNYPFGFGPDGLTPLGQTGSPSSFNNFMTASAVPLSVLGLSSADLASAQDTTAQPSTALSSSMATSSPADTSLDSAVQSTSIVSSVPTSASSSASSPPPPSSTLPSSSPPPPPPTTSAPPPPPTTTPPPPPTTTEPAPTPTPTATDDCDFSYKALWDTFDIRGKSFNMDAFGVDGAGLHTQVSGCGSVSKWLFEWTPDDAVYEWHAWGRLPVGTKGCVGRAVVSAGGLDGSTCHGSG